LLADLEPDQSARSWRAHRHDRPLRQLAVHVDVTCPACPGELDDQLRGKPGSWLGEMRVDALLPAVRALRPKAQPLRGLEDADRLEVGSLKEHQGRRVADLALETAHDRRERDGPLSVRDDEVGWNEAAEVAVEGAKLLARTRATDDDTPLGEARAVEGVQRAT